MKKLPMSFDSFNRYMKIIKDDDKIYSEIYRVSNGCFDLTNIIVSPTLVVELLSYIMHDHSERIDYYCWELHFGEDYEDGMITDRDDNNIKLKTVKDLYDFLIKNYNAEEESSEHC